MFLAGFDGKKLQIIDRYDFVNKSFYINDDMCVDIDALLDVVLEGIKIFAEKGNIDSIGIDTWGGSYVLLEKNGNIKGNVYNCRSKRQHQNYYSLLSKVDSYDLFKQSGVPFERHTVLSQLAYEISNGHSIDQETTFLLLPGYFACYLTGNKVNDASTAVDTVMTYPDGSDWNQKILNMFHIPKYICDPIVPVGTLNGQVTTDKLDRDKFHDTKVINVAGHDTMSAVVSIPDLTEGDCFVSIGTTIIVGAKTPVASTDKSTFEKGYKNCISLFGQNYLCTDITGFWIVNQCFAHFEKDGRIPEITDMIEAAKAVHNNSYIDPTDNIFSSTYDDMPQLIRDECEKKDLKEPLNLGEIGACLFESYALAIARKIQELAEITGKKEFRKIYVISGASRNELLMQDIANALKKEIYAGIPYATLVGNLLIQLVGNNWVNDPESLNRIAANTSQLKEYKNNSSQKWEDKIDRFNTIFR